MWFQFGVRTLKLHSTGPSIEGKVNLHCYSFSSNKFRLEGGGITVLQLTQF